uniref:Uncharacterized protein n=1 Tax=Saccharum spontaneum TaxID=62335 RepID=A0A678THU3_SACSP|nr:hypothetical protein SS16G14_000013 [Saccharum spontaneum]
MAAPGTLFYAIGPWRPVFNMLPFRKGGLEPSSHLGVL